MDDLEDLPEPSRSRAKVLLTCRLCMQYFVDPRVLPCRHSFCRKCLQAMHDRLQAAAKPSTLRIGAMPCPTCEQNIGIPKTGMRGFPVDTKISRIKDLVVNEMAQNISKKINGDSGARGAEDTTADGSARQRRNHSCDNLGAKSDADDPISGYKRNPTYPDFSRFAQYFDINGKPCDPAEFKPTIRGDRHRVGYSNSFHSRQKRRVTVRLRAFDDASDLLEQSERCSSVPHVGRDGKKGSSTPSNTQSNDDVSRQKRSYSERRTTTEQRRSYQTPVTSFEEEDIDSDDSNATTSTVDSTKAKIEEEATLPPLRRCPGTSEQLNELGSGTKDSNNVKPLFTVNGGIEPGKQSEQPKKLKPEPRAKLQRGHVQFETNLRTGRDRTSREVKPTLPVHRENLVTESSSSEKSSVRSGLKRDVLNENRESTVKQSKSERARTANVGDSESVCGSSSRVGSSRSVQAQKESPSESDPKSSTNSPQPDCSSGKPFSEARKFNANTRIVSSDFEPAVSESRSSYTTTRRSERQMFEMNISEDEKCRSKGTTSSPKRQESSEEESRSESIHESRKHVSPISNVQCSDTKNARSRYDRRKELPRTTTTTDSKSSQPESRSRFTRTANDNLSGNSSGLKHDTKSHDHGHDAQSDRKMSETKPEEEKVFFEEKRAESHSEQQNVQQPKKRRQNVTLKRQESKPEAPARRRPSTHEMADSQQQEPFFPVYKSMRTREQMRMDARRSFSRRLHEAMQNYYDDNSLDVTDSAVVQSNLQDHQRSEALYVDGEGGETGGLEKSGEHCGDSSRKRAGSDEGQSPDDRTMPHNRKVKRQETIEIPEPPGRDWNELSKNTRAKYSVERIAPVVATVPEPACADGVYSKWRLEQAEFGIPTSMVITSKGCVIVAEYGQNRVEFFDESDSLVHKMDGVKPYCLAINDKDQIIVGDRKSCNIKIFDEFGCDVAHWDATAFNWLCGIALLPNGQLAVYDRERCKLGIYAAPGEKIREFASFGSTSDSQLCMADFIAADSKGRILVADSGNHCIRAFDANSGSFIGKFGARGDSDGCLDWPKGICVDENDNVIVTDVYNSRVSMFASSGQFVQHLITGVSDPYSICYGAHPSRVIGLTRYSLDGKSIYDVYALGEQ